MKREMPDRALFRADTAQWLRKYNPDWSEAQIGEAMMTLQVVSLVEFYEVAIERHPDLKEIPLLPATPPRSPDSMPETP
jgi:hypothetical protein